MSPTDSTSDNNSQINESSPFGANSVILKLLKVIPNLTFLTKEYREDKRFLELLQPTITNTSSEDTRGRVAEKEEACQKKLDSITTLEKQSVNIVNDILHIIQLKVQQDLFTDFENYGKHVRSDMDAINLKMDEKLDQTQQNCHVAINILKNDMTSEMEKMNKETKEIKTVQIKSYDDLKDRIHRISDSLKRVEKSEWGSIGSINKFMESAGPLLKEKLILPEIEKIEKQQQQQLQAQQSSNKSANDGLVLSKLDAIQTQIKSLNTLTVSHKNSIEYLGSELVQLKARERNIPIEWQETQDKVDRGLLVANEIQNELKTLKKTMDTNEAKIKEMNPILRSILRINNEKGVPEEEIETARILANGEKIMNLEHDAILLRSRINALDSKLKLENTDLKRKFDQMNTTITSQMKSSPRITCNKNINNNNNNNNNDSLSNGLSPPHKRQRIENTIDLTTNNNNSNNNNETMILSLQTSIKQMDHKLQTLVDFIHQFKDTILSENFPVNLEQHIFDIQTALDNHYNMLQFLIDPIGQSSLSTTSSSIVQNGLKDQNKKDEHSHSVSPAMINAIKKMVDHQTELQIEPLKAKIKELENQLKEKN
ncbi:unnamed protein product [Cunninghamella echinulata]